MIKEIGTPKLYIKSNEMKPTHIQGVTPQEVIIHNKGIDNNLMFNLPDIQKLALTFDICASKLPTTPFMLVRDYLHKEFNHNWKHRQIKKLVKKNKEVIFTKLISALKEAMPEMLGMMKFFDKHPLHKNGDILEYYNPSDLLNTYKSMAILSDTFRKCLTLLNQYFKIDATFPEITPYDAYEERLANMVGEINTKKI